MLTQQAQIVEELVDLEKQAVNPPISTTPSDSLNVCEIDAYEEQRLDALATYQILDTRSEKSYDDIVNLASTLCETPIAIISLVDQNRQWFKAKTGISQIETPREVAFCSHAIKTPDDMMIVGDTEKDPRFCDNPLVTGSTSFKFYAAYPIKSASGFPLGTLCVIDTQPRVLTDLQAKSLRTLAGNTENLMELHKTNMDRIRITSELAKTQLELEAFAYAASHDLKSPLRGIDNLAKWIREDAQELDDENNERIVMIQGRISRLENLLDSISQYYSSDQRGPCDEIVNLKAFVQGLASGRTLPENFTIDTSLILERIEVNRNPVERILNHLIDNAIKHNDKDEGKISVSAGIRGDFIEIAVSDNGPGISEVYYDRVFKMFHTLQSRDMIEGAGMGLAVVKKIIDTVGGKIWIEQNYGDGVTFVFTWPKNL